MFVALLIVTYYMTYKTHQNCSQVQALKNPSIRCAGIVQISLNYFLNLSTYLLSSGFISRHAEKDNDTAQLG